MININRNRLSKMTGNILRKIAVALIIIVPTILYSDCKKQAKCGCGEDVLSTLLGTSAYVFFNESYSLFYFQIVGDTYSQYNICNPSEVIKKLTDVKSGDILQVSGSVFWDCTYVSQSSNSSYQSLWRVYQCQVTDMFVNLYGKDKPVMGAPLNNSKPVN